jgi:hypothetical protein
MLGSLWKDIRLDLRTSMSRYRSCGRAHERFGDTGSSLRFSHGLIINVNVQHTPSMRRVDGISPAGS